MDRRIRMYLAFDGRDGLGFRAKHIGQRAAVAFAGHDDDAALAVLIAGKPAIDPVLFPVRGLDVAAEVGAVDLDLARQRIGRVLFGGDGLADFVAEHVGRLVLAIQVAGELQRAMALRAVGKNRDGEKVRPDRKLAAGEDRARGGRELMRARLALEKPARLVRVDRDAAAARAERLAFVLGPTDLAEAIVRFLVRKPRNPS